MEIFKFVTDRPCQVVKEQIDIPKARQILGWKSKTRIDDGLVKALGWVKKIV